MFNSDAGTKACAFVPITAILANKDNLETGADMQLRGWRHLTWWYKTRLAAALFLLTALAMTLGLCVSLSENAVERATLNWVTFSFFPLAVVCLIATLAHLQDGLNNTRGALSNYTQVDDAADSGDSNGTG